jgi:hypothetical protein
MGLARNQRKALPIEKYSLKKSVFRIRIRLGSGFYQVRGSVSVSGFKICIQIQEGKNDNKKIKKERNFMF